MSLVSYPSIAFGLPAGDPWLSVEPAGLLGAILQTVAYADVFDYPLTANEIHRYLIGVPASLEQIQSALQDGRLLPDYLQQTEAFFTLPGREALVAIRRSRAKVAARLWPRALYYGRRIARLPFVRMVAVTGALAMDNVDEDADMDYLVVTQPDRLWSCRALVILLVRWAALHGDVLCPNYFLSERALAHPQASLYSAHEMAQMVPLVGLDVYRRMRACNPWTEAYLPNAGGPPHPSFEARLYPGRGLKALAETALRAWPAPRFERWEMERKARRFSRHTPTSGEASFCADWCKGHFDAHRTRTEAAYTRRLQALNFGFMSAPK